MSQKLDQIKTIYVPSHGLYIAFFFFSSLARGVFNLSCHFVLFYEGDADIASVDDYDITNFQVLHFTRV